MTDRSISVRLFLQITCHSKDRVVASLSLLRKGTHMIILDGGLGRQLKAMGAPFRQPEWSALALMEGP